MLARGEMQCIGATTLDEYRKYIEKDAALERRFQPIKVDEPTVADTIEILKGLRDRYEAHHRVTITDEALVAAANLADRYITGRYLPDKAIDLIDEAGLALRLRRMTAPPDVRELDEKIERSAQEGRGDRRPGLRAGRAAARPRSASARSSAAAQGDMEWRGEGVDLFNEVDEESIAEVCRKRTGIPLTSSPRRRPRSCSAWRTSCTSGSSARTRRSRRSRRRSAAPAPA